MLLSALFVVLRIIIFKSYLSTTPLIFGYITNGHGIDLHWNLTSPFARPALRKYHYHSVRHRRCLLPLTAQNTEQCICYIVYSIFKVQNIFYIKCK